ncbi:helix-turn-helix domain-containing protein [Deinococcus ruber]|uniref:AraC family transcriptional regulator n=1 Tax=Deinococcus ruber TaxID=1848197 RepID=A0A918F4T5_9DEIO|nr:helix-turn-helix domain-containing protein [Deinococcus ruber]GGR01306.1 AraC family transcriptional regulator [Deinococcus ruber]
MSSVPVQLPELRREGFGWRVWSGPALCMPHAHQHDEIEINVVRSGVLEYLWGGEVHRLEAGQVGLFWGARPHRLLSASPGSVLSWLTLPTTRFQRFVLPAALREAVWSGKLLVASEQAMTAALFDQWQHDPADEEHQVTAELEVQAWLRRFALRAQVPAAARLADRTGGAAWDHALSLARRIQQDFAQPLQVQSLAAELGLHPNYVSGVFRKVFGVSLREYLMRCRLAQAQHLLIASELSVLDVALESGFGSTSRFFAAFAERHGCSPRAYRTAHRGQGG